MNIEEIKNYLTTSCSHVTFYYNNKPCGIDPYVKQSGSFEMWYGDEEFSANGIDEVFSTPLFDGKVLAEIFDNITDIEP